MLTQPVAKPTIRFEAWDQAPPQNFMFDCSAPVSKKHIITRSLSETYLFLCLAVTAIITELGMVREGRFMCLQTCLDLPACSKISAFSLRMVFWRNCACFVPTAFFCSIWVLGAISPNLQAKIPDQAAKISTNRRTFPTAA